MLMTVSPMKIHRKESDSCFNLDIDFVLANANTSTKPHFEESKCTKDSRISKLIIEKMPESIQRKYRSGFNNEENTINSHLANHPKFVNRVFNHKLFNNDSQSGSLNPQPKFKIMAMKTTYPSPVIKKCKNLMSDRNNVHKLIYVNRKEIVSKDRINDESERIRIHKKSLPELKKQDKIEEQRSKIMHTRRSCQNIRQDKLDQK